MLVRMLGQITGLRDGKPWPPPGFAVDLPDDEALNLIETHMAVPGVDLESGMEIAVRDQAPVEKRVKAARSALVK